MWSGFGVWLLAIRAPISSEIMRYAGRHDASELDH